MSQEKIDRNTEMLFDYLYNDLTKSAIADKVGIRQTVAWRILKREYAKYTANKDDYEKRFEKLKKHGT